jgi:hypothetical protein
MGGGNGNPRASVLGLGAARFDAVAGSAATYNTSTGSQAQVQRWVSGQSWQSSRGYGLEGGASLYSNAGGHAGGHGGGHAGGHANADYYADADHSVFSERGCGHLQTNQPNHYDNYHEHAEHGRWATPRLLF